MLKHLKVSNLAVIKDLETNFDKGLTIITGETGSGKSLLIGSLNLIRGQRFDYSSVRDKNKKVIVEATFDISKYNLKEFFIQKDIDYFEQTIIRREILPSGRTRAFINDTPVSLLILKELTNRLIDIHSQHDNILLNEQNFQMTVVDAFADNFELLQKYQQNYKAYKKLTNQLETTENKALKAKQDFDYFQYQYQQIQKAQLKDFSEQEQLEKEQKQLSHIQEIKQALEYTNFILNNDENSVIDNLKTAQTYLENISDFYAKIQEFSQRIDSVIIELQDLANEIEITNSSLEYEPERLQQINERLNQIYSLEHKFNVSSIEELITIQKDIEKKLSELTSYDQQIEQIKKQLEQTTEQLKKEAEKLHKKRITAIPKLEKQIENLIKQLGIENGIFKIQIETTNTYYNFGKDKIIFLFSANKNFEPQPLKKVASGGELSRLMLALKYIISQKRTLPTIIFDEIDTGISGKVAAQTGNLIKKMSEKIQILQITHSPQIAAKADKHLYIYKKIIDNKAQAFIKELSDAERIQEIAKMISGEQITEASLKAAKALLKK